VSPIIYFKSYSKFFFILGSRNLKDELHKVGALQTHSASVHSTKHMTKKKKGGGGAGKGCSGSSDELEDVTPRNNKKLLNVHVKHEFPMKDLSIDPKLPLSDLSSASKDVKATTGLSSLDRLAKQRETLNQLLDMTAEESNEWKDIKTKIKANLYRQLELLEDEEL
jgi:hypothetical protein